MIEADATYCYDVFISYSHDDKDWVRDVLLPRLESEGLRVCIDYRDFEPGAPSLTEMERAVLQSRKTLLVLTPDYLASEWDEFKDILAAILDPAARRRHVIPLLLKPCELPLRIRALTYLDFTKPDEIEFQFQRLVAGIRSVAPGAVSTPSVQATARPSPASSLFDRAAERAALERELSQRKRNLYKLREQAATYAAGETPLHLLNQIEAEEVEIRRIEEQLRGLERKEN